MTAEWKIIFHILKTKKGLKLGSGHQNTNIVSQKHKLDNRSW